MRVPINFTAATRVHAASMIFRHRACVCVYNTYVQARLLNNWRNRAQQLRDGKIASENQQRRKTCVIEFAIVVHRATQWCSRAFLFYFVPRLPLLPLARSLLAHTLLPPQIPAIISFLSLPFLSYTGSERRGDCFPFLPRFRLSAIVIRYRAKLIIHCFS